MNDNNGYAVFLFPQALEALGDAVKPFLQDGPAGPHIGCNTIDTGGAFIEMTLEGKTPEGKDVALQLMIPSGMVRMVVSTESEALFGFGLHSYDKRAQPLPAAATAAPTTAEPTTAEPPAS